MPLNLLDKLEYKYEQNMALASKVAQAAGWDDHMKEETFAVNTCSAVIEVCARVETAEIRTSFTSVGE